MLGHSIVSQHFMEPEGSKPNSQELSTCSYPEPDQSSPHLTIIIIIILINKKTPWSESASELYRPRDRRLSAQLVPTIADRGVSRNQRS
jgi:hypothetical protein